MTPDQIDLLIEIQNRQMLALEALKQVVWAEKDTDCILHALCEEKFKLTPENLIPFLEEHLTGLDKQRTLSKVKAVDTKFYKSIIDLCLLRAFDILSKSSAQA